MARWRLESPIKTVRYVGYGLKGYKLHATGQELLVRHLTRATTLRLAA